MKNIVKRTFEAGMAWQQGVVWMRINVAYIKAELPYAAKGGDPAADIEEVAAAFGPAYAKFCDEEFRLFVLARQVAAQAAPLSRFIDQLLILRESFRPWTLQYHEAVQKRRADNKAQMSLVYSLLLCCGGEIHQAHTAFINAIDDYARQLKPPKKGKR